MGGGYVGKDVSSTVTGWRRAGPLLANCPTAMQKGSWAEHVCRTIWLLLLLLRVKKNGPEMARNALEESCRDIDLEDPQEVLAGAGMKRVPDPTRNLHTSSALLQLPSLMSLTTGHLTQELLGTLPTITSALVSPALAQTLTPLLSLADPSADSLSQGLSPSHSLSSWL